MMASAQIQKHQIPSNMEGLSLVERLIEDIRTFYKIPEELYGNILVSVTEAINNAIRHGNKFDENKSVHFSFEQSDDAYIFQIKDEGPGFDFLHVPDPTHPDNLEKPDGRGIFIMDSLADEVNFTEEGRMVEIKFNRQSSVGNN